MNSQSVGWWLLQVLIIIASSNSLIAQNLKFDTLGLERLQQLASERSVLVLQARQEAEQAELEVLKLRADLRPQVTLNATVPSYFSSFRETVQPDGTVKFQPVNINNSSVSLAASQAFAKTGGELRLSTGLQRFDDYEQNVSLYNGSVARLSYAQPLWGFNALKWRQRVVPITNLRAVAGLREARLSAKLQATNAFFQLAMAAQAYSIADTNTQASRRLLVIAETRLELGKITRGDLAQLQLEAASAEQNKLAAEQLMASSSASIYNLIGVRYAGIIEPVGRSFDESRLLLLQEAKLPSIEIALAAARNSRPELIEARLNQLQAESDLEREKRSTGFQADLFASVGLIRSDPKLPEVYRDPQIEQIVELGLSIPILDWGRRRAGIKQREVTLGLSEELVQRQEMNIETLTRLALEQADRTRRQLVLLVQVRNLAYERYNIARESYLLGAVPLTDLTLAQQARDARLRDYLSGIADAFSASATLTALTGIN